jgi:hypothetical protein
VSVQRDFEREQLVVARAPTDISGIPLEHWTMAHRAALIAFTAATLLAGGSADGQAPAATVAAWDAPAVGAQAPDFQLAGATRYGLLKNPVRLSDFRDKTVVIAFFAQARTKG